MALSEHDARSWKSYVEGSGCHEVANALWGKIAFTDYDGEKRNNITGQENVVEMFNIATQKYPHIASMEKTIGQDAKENLIEAAKRIHAGAATKPPAQQLICDRSIIIAALEANL